MEKLDLNETQALQSIPLDEEELDEVGEDDDDKSKPVAFLQVLENKHVEKTIFPLFTGENVIGRDRSSSVCIKSQTLSKQHAVISIKKGSAYCIYDVGSLNKTKKSSCVLKPGIRYELQHEDVIVFADIECQFTLPESKSNVDSNSDNSCDSLTFNKTTPVQLEKENSEDDLVTQESRDNNNFAFDQSQYNLHSNGLTQRQIVDDSLLQVQSEEDDEADEDEENEEANDAAVVAETPAPERRQHLDLDSVGQVDPMVVSNRDETETEPNAGDETDRSNEEADDVADVAVVAEEKPNAPQVEVEEEEEEEEDEENEDEEAEEPMETDDQQQQQQPQPPDQEQLAEAEEEEPEADNDELEAESEKNAPDNQEEEEEEEEAEAVVENDRERSNSGDETNKPETQPQPEPEVDELKTAVLALLDQPIAADESEPKATGDDEETRVVKEAEEKEDETQIEPEVEEEEKEEPTKDEPKVEEKVEELAKEEEETEDVEKRDEKTEEPAETMKEEEDEDDDKTEDFEEKEDTTHVESEPTDELSDEKEEEEETTKDEPIVAETTTTTTTTAEPEPTDEKLGALKSTVVLVDCVASGEFVFTDGVVKVSKTTRRRRGRQLLTLRKTRTATPADVEKAPKTPKTPTAKKQWAPKTPKTPAANVPKTPSAEPSPAAKTRAKKSAPAETPTREKRKAEENSENAGKQRRTTVDADESTAPRRMTRSAKNTDPKATPKATPKPVKRQKTSKAPKDEEKTPKTPKEEEKAEKTATKKKKSDAKDDKSIAKKRKTDETVVKKPKILFTGGSDKKISNMVQSLGGSVVESIDECTHLISDKIRRTVKLLCTLSKGYPVVTAEWIHASHQKGHFVDPTPYLVEDRHMEQLYKFSLIESLRKAKEKPLLSDYALHVTESVLPGPEEMKKIIECAGGQFLDKLPVSESKKTPVLIVSCPEDLPVCSKAIKKKIKVVDKELILTGVLRQEFDVDDYLLTAF